MTRMRIITRTLTVAALLAATSCSSTVRSGNSSMFLVIDSLQAIPGGASTGQAGSILYSDLRTTVTTGNDSTGRACTQISPCFVVFADNGSATLELARKDVTLTTPTSNNQVTINRVHVHFRFADGSGVPGSTVPADFDTFATATVPPTGSTTISFELVRVQAKESPPLTAVLASGGVLGVVADLTFIGTDQVGNAVSATGSMQIQFGDWQ